MNPQPKPVKTRAPRGQARRIKRKRSIGWRRKETKAAGTLTNVEWGLILAAYCCRCAYCGEAEAVQVDHITPIAKGGGHTACNVAPACGRCNYRKGQSLKWEARLLPGHPYRKETP